MGRIKNKKAKRQTDSNRTKATSDVQAIGSALSDLGQVAADQARIAGGVAADKAQILAKEGREWAQPRLAKAGEVLSQAQQEAQERGRKAAAQGRKAAREKRKQFEDEYVPRIQRALQDAADAAKTEKPLGEKAQEVGKVTQRALTEPTAKKKAKRRGGKLFGWVLVGSLAAGAGYLLWRRTQPVEDPWAEEYWDNATTPPAQDAAGEEEPQPGEAAEEAAEEDVTGDAPAEDDAEEVIGDVNPEDGRKLGEL